MEEGSWSRYAVGNFLDYLKRSYPACSELPYSCWRRNVDSAEEDRVSLFELEALAFLVCL